MYLANALTSVHISQNHNLRGHWQFTIVMHWFSATNWNQYVGNIQHACWICEARAVIDLYYVRGLSWHHEARRPTERKLDWDRNKKWESVTDRLREGDIDGVKSESQFTNWITSFIWRAISCLINEEPTLLIVFSRSQGFLAYTAKKGMFLPVGTYTSAHPTHSTNTKDALHNSDNCSAKQTILPARWWNIYSKKQPAQKFYKYFKIPQASSALP